VDLGTVFRQGAVECGAEVARLDCPQGRQLRRSGPFRKKRVLLFNSRHSSILHLAYIGRIPWGAAENKARLRAACPVSRSGREARRSTGAAGGGEAPPVRRRVDCCRRWGGGRTVGGIPSLPPLLH